MAKDDDILRDAIIGTEKEIFASAFDQEELTHDETGDRSLEAMGDGLEGQIEHDDEDDNETDGQSEQLEAKDEGKDGTEVEKVETKSTETHQEPPGRVPPGRLREEAERARNAIAERDALKAQLESEKSSSQKAIDELRAQFNGMMAALQRPQAPVAPQQAATQQEAPPDLFENPAAFAEYLQNGVKAQLDAVQKQVRDQQVNASIESARTRHGQEFEAAWKAISTLDYKNPDNVALVRRMEAMPNPGEAVMTWHKRNEVLREVGENPAEYKARVAEETRNSLMADPDFRRELLDTLRGDAMTGDNGRPRTQTRLPASLSRAQGGNGRAPNDLEIYDGSDSAAFKSAWT